MLFKRKFLLTFEWLLVIILINTVLANTCRQTDRQKDRQTEGHTHTRKERDIILKTTIRVRLRPEVIKNVTYFLYYGT